MLEFRGQESTGSIFLIFSWLKMKLFWTFWAIYSDNFKTFLRQSPLDYLKNCPRKFSQLNSFSDNRKSCWQPEWSAKFRPLWNKTLFRHSKAKRVKNWPKKYKVMKSKKIVYQGLRICRHLNLVQTHKYSRSIMGLNIFQIKLFWLNSSVCAAWPKI